MGRDLSLPRPEGEEERDLAHARFAEIVRPLERQSNERLNGGGRQLCFDSFRADPERFRQGAKEALEQGAHPVKLLVWMVVEDTLPESGELAPEPERVAPSLPDGVSGVVWAYTCSKCHRNDSLPVEVEVEVYDDGSSNLCQGIKIPCAGKCGQVEELALEDLSDPTKFECSECEPWYCLECRKAAA